MDRFFQLGDFYRYPRPTQSDMEFVDDLRNFFWVTATENQTMAQLEKGINCMKKEVKNGRKERPAILTRTSPQKAGSDVTPWDDIYDLPNGHIRYYGDNKSPDQKPEDAPGNLALLEQFAFHSSPDPLERKRSAPILFFRSEAESGTAKGYIRFYGYGIIKNVELITQYDRSSSRFFTNFVFDFAILGLLPENNRLNWDWIVKGRDEEASYEEAFKLAPESWKIFIKQGQEILSKIRHNHTKLLVQKTDEQKPEKGTKEEEMLVAIYEHYATSNRFHFEALAELVTAKVLSENGARYKMGWVTVPSGDGGADFIGRLDLGSEFSTVNVIVLGQAKCEKINTPTNGNHIARTVARLKRGWIGAYVTTSYFSEAVQKEIIEDSYPILLIPGKRIAQEVERLMNERGINKVSDFLTSVDKEYTNRLKSKRPEEILLDVNSVSSTEILKLLSNDIS